MARAPDARTLACTILERVERDRAYAGLLLREHLDILPSHADRALATELVYGTLRWRGRLDYLLRTVSRRPLDSLDGPVRQALRVAAYQLGMLTRIPAFAAVNEAVAFARRVAGPGAAAFVNGVLRALATGLDTVVYPDLATDPLNHLMSACSLPRWLGERWLTRCGPEGARTLAMAINERPPLTLRVNTRRVTRAEFVRACRAEGLAATPAAVSPEGVVLAASNDIAHLAAYRDGLIAVQDEAAQLVGHLLDPQPGEAILDLCAAPGGKATHAATLMEDRGRVLGIDLNVARLRLAAAEATRLGLTSLRWVVADATRPLPLARGVAFDRVLVDAPCSGTGVLRRHPEAKWVEPDLGALAALQSALLEAAAPLLKAEGLIVYSVCSLEPEEGPDVVARFLAAHPGWRTDAPRSPIIPETLVRDAALVTSPVDSTMDGFYAVACRRPA